MNPFNAKAPTAHEGWELGFRSGFEEAMRRMPPPMRYYVRTGTEPLVSAKEKAQVANISIGHTEDGSGLQKHSIGGIYPLCVVGFNEDPNTFHWRIENLQNDTVAAYRGVPGTTGPATVWHSRRWGLADLDNANAFAKWVKANPEKVEWVPRSRVTKA
jgi:hypothetical protein